MNKILHVIRGIFSAITTLALIVVALFVILTYGLRPFGITTGIVQSGSMEPVIRTGSLSIIKEADAADVKVGDIIVYNGAGDMQIEHRVTAINEEEQTLMTKGDANEAVDAGAVSFEQVVGLHVFSVPYVGYVSAWMRTHCTAVLCACALLACC